MFLLLSCTLSQSPSNTPIESIYAQVVIVGGGASGMATAKRLLELGVEPLILERENTLGGAGVHAGRFFAVDTELQQENGIEDNITSAQQQWVDFSGGEPSEAINLFIDKSSETLQWLEDNGAVFELIQSDIGAGETPRIHKLSSNHPHPLVQWAEILNPYTHTNTEVQSIEKIGDTYVIETTNDVSYSTEYVVIASGGFARNTSLVEEVKPELAEIDWYIEAWPGMTGSSLGLLEFLEVNTTNLSNIGLYSHSVEDPITGFPEVMIIPALQRSLIVTNDGVRPFNEQLTQSLEAGKRNLELGGLFAVFDYHLWQGTTFQGLGYNYDSVESLSSIEFEEVGTIFQAEQIDQLAIEMGLPPDIFANTVQQYNQGILQGTDEFGKDLTMVNAIQTPPFYAVKLAVTTAKSFGGAMTNQSGQVYKNNTVSEKLYAVGEASGFLGTDAIGWGFSGSITACYYQGKAAAESIVSSMD
jgi:fumarate reductase flavoprotein subunit